MKETNIQGSIILNQGSIFSVITRKIKEHIDQSHDRLLR